MNSESEDVSNVNNTLTASDDSSQDRADENYSAYNGHGNTTNLL